MAPARVGRILAVRVLAVVDQQRCIGCEVEAGDPLGLERIDRCAERGLVVRDVAKGIVTFGYPISERRTAVGDRGCTNARRSDLPLDLRRVAEGNVTRQLAHLDG